MNELVSIITPSYNSEKYISDCIESVIAQTYTNWELLITDDCSKDNSIKVIQQYVDKDPRIHLFVLKENSGAAVARNNSIKEAKGRYIAFCDSDDFWMPDKLEKQLEFMRQKDCALSYTSIILCDESGTIKGLEVCPSSHTFKQNWCDNRVGTSTAIYDIQKVGKTLMPSLRKRQDWGLFMTILGKCRISYGMKLPLAYYRMGQESLSKNKKSLVKYNIAVYQTVLGWSYFRSLLFFLTVYMPCWTFKKWIMARYNA